MSVVVYGASDDLIEIDGDVREEFAYVDEGDGVVVVGRCGEAVEIYPHLGNTWGVNVKVASPGIFDPVRWKVIPRPDGSGENGDLAVRVELRDPLVYKIHAV